MGTNADERSAEARIVQLHKANQALVAERNGLELKLKQLNAKLGTYERLVITAVNGLGGAMDVGPGMLGEADGYRMRLSRGRDGWLSVECKRRERL